MNTKIGSFIVCLLVIWCQSTSSEGEENTLSSGLKKFSNKFYEKSAKRYSGNIVTSPYSAQTALLLLFMGAKGQTADEISNVFGLSSLSRNEVEDTYTKYHKSISGHNFLHVANKIYVSKRFTLKPTFNEVAKKTFDSEVATIDFDTSEKAAQEINDWIQIETNGKIKDLFKSDDLPTDTRMVVANAIYFKGEWKEQFMPENTRQMEFWNTEEESVEVDTMHTHRNFRTGLFSDYKLRAIELEYKDSDLSMMILLPLTRTGFADMEKEFAKIDVFAMTKDLRIEHTFLYLPKFKIETELNLIDILKEMGVQKMFTDSAEFQDLFDEEPDVIVSKAIQKAFIEIDEKGSEAAAATGVGPAGPAFVPDFVVNHPFIYLIKSSEIVLFMGSVTKF